MIKRANTAQKHEYKDYSRDTDSNATSKNWQIRNPNRYTEIRCGLILFEDDTGVGYTHRNDISGKLTTYNTSTPYNCLVNWKNVLILIAKAGKIAQCHKWQVAALLLHKMC